MLIGYPGKAEGETQQAVSGYINVRRRLLERSLPVI